MSVPTPVTMSAMTAVRRSNQKAISNVLCPTMAQT